MVKEINIKENAGIGRFGEYVRVAVPCVRGEVLPNAPLSIMGAAEQVRPCQAKALKQWPDGSAKWLLVDFAATVPAGGAVTYRLAPAVDTHAVPSSFVQITPGADEWQVDTGLGSFTIDSHIFRPFVMVRRREGDEVLHTDGSSCVLRVDGKTDINPVVENMRLEDDGPLRAIIRMAGRFEPPGVEGVRFNSRLHFFAGSMSVQVEFTLHNPKAARHPGGLWDLGDPGSFLFEELAFVFSLANGTHSEIQCKPEPGVSPVIIPANTRMRIYQESSGGENWRSPNHQNKEGRVPFTRRGYVVEVEEVEKVSGLRASPLVWCGSYRTGVAVALPHFWQEFPKAVETDKNQLTISLFSAQYSDLHELQGGEQKTHNFLLDFAAGPDSLEWALNPLQAMASPLDYRASGIFNDLPDTDDLIDQFATSTDILEKRELVDEYGWRNFGEVYADHEAVHHNGSEQFVSHYNNQYDLCAGAYRKFFSTGDPEWGEIAADLARHVRDIDIYHTDNDREEYNHGLFWHTDHYIDADLSTHRSFSRRHLEKKEARFCGGGPGAEHCYTTGLMIHYFQTGNPAFRQAVIDLAEWVLRSLAGSRTVLAALKRGVNYFNLWRTSRSSRRLFPRYPLTRGTGNAITACLDAFEVCGEIKFLDTAESLIHGTIHPGDDIYARNLLDAETAWSYTVLLIAVAKYLDKKSELDKFDDGFSYARACLLAYAEWMLNNEYPYLMKPEILEYPNETWAAQDIRKSAVFYLAACYSRPDRREAFLQKGRYFSEAAREELLRRRTSSFSRPVALMLQNGWVGSRLSDEDFPPLAENGREELQGVSSGLTVSGWPTPYLTLGSAVARICSEVAGAARNTSIRRELAWLMARMM